MRLVRHIILGIAALPLLGGAARAQATGNASVNASAFVIGIAPLAAFGVNDLSFGTITAGQPALPPSLVSNSGRFVITGEPNAPLSFDFVLPATLVDPLSRSVPISFSNQDGIRWLAFPTSFVRIDPRARSLLTLDATGTLVLGILGSITAPVGTPPGLYSATITLEVSY